MHTRTYPHRRKNLALTLAVLLLLAGTVGTRPARAATATLEPTSVTNGYTVRAGNRFIVRGSGFNANENVSTWASFGLRPTVYATAGGQADRSGDVGIEIKTGRFWEPGWWALTISSMDGRRQGVAHFMIEAAPPNGTLDMAPARDIRRGETINLHGAGFNANDSIKAWVTRPNGTAVEIERGLSQSGNEVWFSYTIAPDATTGRWSVTAYGQGSERLLIRDFNVTP
jgi:hypothetical protein